MRRPTRRYKALDELVKSQGCTSATVRAAADPLQSGELRGKEGCSREPRLAERSYRMGVEAQRTATAGSVIGTMAAAPDEKDRAEARRAVQADERVAGELRELRRRCRAAVRGGGHTHQAEGWETAGRRHSVVRHARAAAGAGPDGRSDRRHEDRRAGHSRSCRLGDGRATGEAARDEDAKSAQQS